MTGREKYVKYRGNYMIIGDLYKPFHRPECECEDCEEWRRQKGRPTHKELRAMPPQEAGPS